MTKYNSLDEYLHANEELVNECVNQIIEEGRPVDNYIYSVADKFFGRSKKKREYYLNNFLEQYTLFKDEEEDDLLYNSLKAVTNQLLADYYIYVAKSQRTE